MVIAGTVDIQGLVAIANSDDMGAVYITWMVTAPQNNKAYVDVPKYSGVGGHLFAVASEKSVDYGHSGVVTGYAANKELVEHYCNTLGAIHIRAQHPYQIVIEEKEAKEIRDTYDYDWTSEEI